MGSCMWGEGWGTFCPPAPSCPAPGCVFWALAPKLCHFWACWRLHCPARHGFWGAELPSMPRAAPTPSVPPPRVPSTHHRGHFERIFDLHGHKQGWCPPVFPHPMTHQTLGLTPKLCLLPVVLSPLHHGGDPVLHPSKMRNPLLHPPVSRAGSESLGRSKSVLASQRFNRKFKNRIKKNKK